MKPRIYVETSVISYLAARPSADAINLTRQHFSYLLWQERGKPVGIFVISWARLPGQRLRKSCRKPWGAHP